MREQIIHTIGEFSCRDDQVLYVDWNARAMMVATTVCNRIARGIGLLNLLPDVLQRRALVMKVGTLIEPLAPIVRTEIQDIRNAEEQSHSAEPLPGVLLDFPADMIVFESGTRLVVARWSEVLAVGWKGSGFWFAIGDIAVVVHSAASVEQARRIPFLQKLLSTREPGCYTTLFPEALQQTYDLKPRYHAERIYIIHLTVLVQDRYSIQSAIPLNSRWENVLSTSQCQSIPL